MPVVPTNLQSNDKPYEPIISVLREMNAMIDAAFVKLNMTHEFINGNCVPYPFDTAPENFRDEMCILREKIISVNKLVDDVSFLLRGDAE